MLIRLGPVGLGPSAPVLPAHFSVCALTTLSTPAERTTSSVQRWASAETALVDQAVMHLRFRFIHATYHPSDLPNHLPGKPEPRQPSCLHWLPSCEPCLSHSASSDKMKSATASSLASSSWLLKSCASLATICRTRFPKTCCLTMPRAVALRRAELDE